MQEVIGFDDNLAYTLAPFLVDINIYLSLNPPA
ncbi:hypothetical protein CAL7102_03091 [Dulcicalothrix desertica PCC 7102]|nr:hypothetical protein CAL7102_03091 [Dulcicalothrix desertica PCC 7102]